MIRGKRATIEYNKDGVDMSATGTIETLSRMGIMVGDVWVTWNYIKNVAIHQGE